LDSEIQQTHGTPDSAGDFVHQSRHSHPHLGIAIVLAMSMALSPLSIDAYLPAFPAIADSLGVSIHDVSLSISIYVLLLAVGQLIAGPLSDQFGRAPVMLGGLGIFALASGLITRVDSNQELMLLRSLQGFGGGCIVVCVPAIVRDRLSGQEAARFFSLIGLIMILAPAIAPGIGSLMLAYFAWPAIFLMLFLYAVTLGVLLQWVVFSGPQPHTRSQDSTATLSRYRIVISTRPALRFLFLQALCFAVMLLFITHSSFIYQQHFGATPKAFALLFGANIIFMMVVNLVNRRLLKTVESRVVLRWAVTLQAVGILLLILVMAFAPTLWLFLPAMMITVGAMGAITPNTQACFMEYFPKHGGTASALLGASQFSLGGLISVSSALLPETVIAVIFAQAACSVLCLLLVWVFGRSTDARIQ
jgi:DHA1 family bicyclomycin/chloramphenicol resistance-like MFS transporter